VAKSEKNNNSEGKWNTRMESSEEKDRTPPVGSVYLECIYIMYTDICIYILYIHIYLCSYIYICVYMQG